MTEQPTIQEVVKGPEADLDGLDGNDKVDDVIVASLGAVLLSALVLVKPAEEDCLQ